MRNKDGKFLPGNPGKPVGAKNKIDRELRDKISDFLDGNFDKVKQDFEKLDPKDRTRVFIDLLQYSVPKLQAMQLQTEFDALSDDQLDKLYNRLIGTNE